MILKMIMTLMEELNLSGITPTWTHMMILTKRRIKSCISQQTTKKNEVNDSENEFTYNDFTIYKEWCDESSKLNNIVCI